MIENETLDIYKVFEYKNTNIYTIENIFSDELCKELIEIIDKTSNTKYDYHKTNNVRCYQSNLVELLKGNDEFYYKFSTDVNEYTKLLYNVNNKRDIITNDMNCITKQQINNTFIKVNKQMTIVSELIKKKNDHLNLEHNIDYSLRKIYGATRNHSDGVLEVYHSNIMSIKENYLNEYRMIRNATIIFSLNNDYEGGIFNFTHQNVSFRLKKGSVLIFPPYWTHPHEVSDLLNNTYRYTLSTWCCQKL